MLDPFNVKTELFSFKQIEAEETHISLVHYKTYNVRLFYFCRTCGGKRNLWLCRSSAVNGSKVNGVAKF